MVTATVQSDGLPPFLHIQENVFTIYQRLCWWHSV